MKVQSFAKNEVGRDFVVGDIHGCFSTLTNALWDIGFDAKKDRLFSVGDLVDRGPECEEVVDWLKRPWFHAVRGNHDQMAIGVAVGKHDQANYILNGGGWFLQLSDEKKAVIAEALNQLPLAIEVETERGLIGIVHADAGSNWDEFKEEVIRAADSKSAMYAVMEQAMWYRKRIQTGNAVPVKGVAFLYVGHTPVLEPRALGNVHYIDTGACFGRALTLVDMATGKEHRTERHSFLPGDKDAPKIFLAGA